MRLDPPFKYPLAGGVMSMMMFYTDYSLGLTIFIIVSVVSGVESFLVM